MSLSHAVTFEPDEVVFDTLNEVIARLESAFTVKYPDEGVAEFVPRM